jgi:hypothetical protein
MPRFNRNESDALNCALPAGRLSLRPVSSRSEEAAAIEAMKSAGSGQAVHAPMLDTGALPALIAGFLDRHGLDATDGQMTNYSGSASPGLIVASPGVEANVADLAAALSGSRVCHLPLTPADASHARHPSALFVLNPAETAALSILDAIAFLERENFAWGFALATDPVMARFSLFKALLPNQVRATGALEFIGRAHGDERSIDARLARKTDVTIICGHANTFDLSLSPNDILCARAGDAGAQGAEDVFPCFNDGRCFRRDPHRPPPTLHSAHSSGATILVIAGCGVMPLAPHRIDFSRGLVHQASAGRSAAFLATCAETVERPDVDLLCASLIAEGRPLGDVVREINAERRGVRGDSTGFPPGIGPFLLFGNPRLRLAGFPMRRITAVSQTDDQQNRLLLARSSAGRDDMLLRVELPPASPGTYVALKALSGNVGQAALHRRGDDRVAYVLAGPALEDAELVIKETPSDPWHPVAQCAARAWSEFAFWPMFIDDAASTLTKGGKLRRDLEGMAARLPAQARSFSRMGTSLRSQPDILVSERRMEWIADVLWGELAAWSRTMLALVVRLRHVGPLASYGASPYFAPTPAEEDPVPCFCRSSKQTGQRFSAATGVPARILRQCGLCGASIDEDGRSLLRVLDLPLRIERGAMLVCDGEAAAEGDAYAMVRATMVLETWGDGRELVSSAFEQLLAPGAKAAFSLRLEVPRDLTPGIYPVSVLGLVNGALYIIRRMTSIG